MEATETVMSGAAQAARYHQNRDIRLPDRPAGLKILLVDDEPDFNLLVAEALTDAGHQVATAANGEEALSLITSELFDVMVCDIRLPKLDGLSLFRRTRQESPDTTVILMTAYAAIQDAVGAVKEGAYDYLTKPFDIDELTLRMKRIAEHRALLRELETARAQLAAVDAKEAIVGRSVQMLRLLDRVNTIATSHAPVLLTGESGTGKELVARALHERGTRRDRPLVVVNCAAFPDTLLEAELFGHERGAFTGAVKRRDGRFRAAHTGTLMLDEIAEMSLPAQAKLLRVLQEGEFQRLGNPRTYKVNVRVAAATNRNLAEEVRKGRFREDLYYRLNVFPIQVPPLRERAEDIPSLVFAFLEEFSTRIGKKVTKVPRHAMEKLQAHSWPGNIRELRNVIEHSVILTTGDMLQLSILGDDPIRETEPITLAEAEREHILKALGSTGWRIKGPRGAAQRLGLEPSTLYSRMQKLEIPNRRQKDEMANGI
jgi:DNA-binding NtrC family response regulator